MSDNGPKFFTITQLSETEEIQCFLARSLTTITQDVAPEQRGPIQLKKIITKIIMKIITKVQLDFFIVTF